MQQQCLSTASREYRNSKYKTAVLLCTITGILFAVSGCQSSWSGSGYRMESKYSLKYRKSHISCRPEGSSSALTCALPLRVTQQSLDNLFSSIDESLGTRYRYGGSSPDGFDCSGLVLYLYQKNFRMILPRTASDLAALGTIVQKNSLRPGDLVFFSNEGRNIDHVGIFVGQKSFAHASRNGVKFSHLYERYYESHYAFAARLITTE
jgi:murein DD-endopeptidase / murein LD-carboxypeptidase